MNKKEIVPQTVSELNNSIRDILNKGMGCNLAIVGEISELKQSNGSIYLTLRDEQSQIRVAAWNQKFDVCDGDSVVVIGKINCYSKNGTYSIRASDIKKIGCGDIHANYEKLKQEFDKIGYFSKSKANKSVPRTIKRLGILTAQTGAALQDMLTTLRKNNFKGKILVKNCLVQGERCEQSVVCGIEYFNQLHKTYQIDCLIVGRGGGSFEDLMGFSAKGIVEAINSSPIFIISAVGHEVDTMLSDYAADMRAHTPTAAAELVSASQAKSIQLLSRIESLASNKKNTISRMIESYKHQILQLEKSICSPTQYIEQSGNLLNMYLEKAKRIITDKFDSLRGMIEILEVKNNSYSLTNNLQKGYAVVLDTYGQIIRNVSQISDTKTIRLVFADGEAEIDSKNIRIIE